MKSRFLDFALRATLCIFIFVLIFSPANAQDEKIATAVNENSSVDQKSQVAEQIKFQPTSKDQEMTNVTPTFFRQPDGIPTSLSRS